MPSGPPQQARSTHSSLVLALWLQIACHSQGCTQGTTPQASLTHRHTGKRSSKFPTAPLCLSTRSQPGQASADPLRASTKLPTSPSSTPFPSAASTEFRLPRVPACLRTRTSTGSPSGILSGSRNKRASADTVDLNTPHNTGGDACAFGTDHNGKREVRRC